MKGELGLHNNGLQDVTAAVAKNHRKSIWKRIVSVLACIVVFCTTYALILPALTLERDAECGLEEHIHTEACYIKDDSNSAEVLVCTAETLGLHQHTDACIGMDGEYICGYSDFVIHSHNEYCYDENGVLVCTLPEIFPHTHTDSCYLMSEDAASELPGGFDASLDNGLDSITGHVHTDECYVNELGELICTLPTEAAHVHTDECYLTTNELCCPLTEGEGHIHGEGCFDETGALVCTVPESAGHTHTPECYLTSSTLICTLAEGEQVHVHTDECYAQNRVLVCGIPEEPSFVDGDSSLTFPEGDAVDSYATEGLPGEPSFENNITTEPFIIDDTAENGDRGEPICGMTEIIPHRHDDSCFDANGMLICGMTEVLEHIHTQDCMGRLDDSDELTCTIAEGDGAHFHTVEGGCFDEEGTLICEIPESEGHVHSAICYGNWILVCEMEEHTHTDECYSSDEPDADPEREVYCGKEAHTHAGECINENGVVVCTIEEHKHGEECYVNPYADLETFCGKVEHIHSTECIDANGVISCGIEEHSHGEECYVEDELIYYGEVNATADVIENSSAFAINLLGNDLLMPLANDGAIHDFGEDITNAQLKYMDNGVWKDITPDHKIKEGEKVKFTIKYNLPPNSISNESPVITYKLPDTIKISAESSGNVLNTDKTKIVGSYVISTDGTITISFKNDYVEDNTTGGSFIEGDISFEGEVDNSKVRGDNQTISITDKVTIPGVTVLPPDNSDIRVDKSGSPTVNENGEIEYTVTIRSENGTTHPVKVTDWMENVSLVNGVSGITVTGPSGVVNPAITQTNSGFEFELPKMDPATSYTITYKCKLADGYDKSKVDINTNNTLKAESEKDNGHNTSWQDDHKVTYTQQYLGKTGTKTDDGRILWTITVNAGKQDIGGWTLNDNFNGSTPEGPFTMTDSAGNITTITLPYTFDEGSNGTYTITYTTDAEATPGTNLAKNEAKLIDPKDQSDNPKVNVEIPVDKTFEPVEKIGSPDIVVDAASGDAILEWTVNISGPLTAQWKYEDYLGDNYNGVTYLTQEQYDEVVKALAVVANGYSYTIEPYIYGEYDKTIRGFKVYFNTNLPKGEMISFTYYSTGILDGGRGDKVFKNKGVVNGTGGREVEIKYSPLVQKHDDNNAWNQAESNHKYNDINGVLKWKVLFTAPENLDSDLVITEHLPDGITLDVFKFTVTDYIWNVQLNLNGDTKVSYWDAANVEHIYTIKSEQIGNDVIVTIPKQLMENEAFAAKEKSFYIEAKINDEYLYPTDAEDVYVGIFKNSVDISTSNGTPLGSTNQIQTITKDDSKPPIKKGSGNVQNNIVPYTLTINPQGKDLLPDSDTLTLIDTVKLKEGDYSYVDFVLTSGSLKVYSLNPDGSKGIELDMSDFPYTYEETRDPNDSLVHIHTIKMNLPDETPLFIEYEYVAYADDKVGSWPEITNTAELQGVASNKEDSENKAKFEIQSSSASAGTSTLTILKYDKDNYGLKLDGAQFHLYKYNAETAKYEVVLDEDTGKPQVFETGSSGKPSDKGKVTPTVVKNTAYYVVEVKAPDGYLLEADTKHYFMLRDNTVLDDFPETKPDDFSGQYLSAGQQIAISNESLTTSIKVQKKWKEVSGKPYEPTVGSVSFNLFMKLTDKDGNVLNERYSYPLDGTGYNNPISITAENNWKIELKNLPKTIEYTKPDGSKVTANCSYFVEEINDNIDIKVTYEKNDGILTGTITITNTVDTAPKHELPSTGGGGVAPITALGGGVIGISLLLALVKRAQDKKTRESG